MTGRADLAIGMLQQAFSGRHDVLQGHQRLLDLRQIQEAIGTLQQALSDEHDVLQGHQRLLDLGQLHEAIGVF